MIVESRPIDWFDWLPGDLYRVTSHGDIQRFFKGKSRWKRVKSHRANRTYSVILQWKRKRLNISVSTLVLRAFVGPRPFGCMPFHFPDSDLANNRLNNLRWAPCGEALKGGFQNVPDNKGAGNPQALLEEEDIPRIREMYRANFTVVEIADSYEVSRGTIDCILKGRTWRHVVDPLGPIKMRRGARRLEIDIADLNPHHP